MQNQNEAYSQSLGPITELFAKIWEYHRIFAKYKEILFSGGSYVLFPSVH